MKACMKDELKIMQAEPGTTEFLLAVTNLSRLIHVHADELETVLTSIIMGTEEDVLAVPTIVRETVALRLVDYHLLHWRRSIAILQRTMGCMAKESGVSRDELDLFAIRRSNLAALEAHDRARARRARRQQRLPN